MYLVFVKHGVFTIQYLYLFFKMNNFGKLYRQIIEIEYETTIFQMNRELAVC